MIDFNVLYSQTDWTYPEMKQRLRPAGNMFLVPNHVPMWSPENGPPMTQARATSMPGKRHPAASRLVIQSPATTEPHDWIQVDSGQIVEIVRQQLTVPETTEAGQNYNLWTGSSGRIQGDPPEQKSVIKGLVRSCSRFARPSRFTFGGLPHLSTSPLLA
jgi:hypothetical protein